MTGKRRSPFDIGGPLPMGLTALEASAGTGKTHALSSLAARFVAERQVPASGLCIVSFTDAATAELRSRVRARLVEVQSHLAAARDHRAGPSDDALLTAVADAPPDEVDRRLLDVTGALAEFDAATITTIHGFCRRVLAGSGASAGDLDITDGASDVSEAVTDLLIARFGGDAECPIDAGRLEHAVRLRLAMPDATMWRLPDDVRAPSDGQRIHHQYCDATADLVDEICSVVRERRTARRRRTFDGLLADTRALLAGPDGAAVVAALRQRFQVMLIDEFQDTDTVQWDIFRRAFVEPGPAGLPSPTVVIVGDPKQSIYRFRSAELSAYLSAVSLADGVATLSTNWRSDASLLTALDAVFSGFEFGDPGVVFHQVDPAPRSQDLHDQQDQQDRRLDGAGSESLALRWVSPPPGGGLSAADAQAIIERDVVHRVAELLDGSGERVVTVRLDTPPDQGPVRRRLRPSDIAILTRSNSQASLLTRLLSEAGIAAASASNESVLESEAGRQWRYLLSALEQPGSGGRVRAAALGWSLGLTGEQLIGLDEAGLDELHEQFRSWSHELSTVGLSRLLSLVRAAGLHARVLSAVGGERHLTDFDHIAELLLTITAGRPATATQLLGHLDALDRGVIDSGGGSGGKQDAMAPDVLARRIDRDDEAVQVLTIHRAKGLEFGIVLCPFLWSGSVSSGPPHAQVDGARQIQTPWITRAGSGKWLESLTAANRAEVVGESLRVLYVALTRARHRCEVWWPTLTTRGQRGGALGELLAHATGSDGPPADPVELDAVVARSGGTLAVHEVPHHPFGVGRTGDDGGGVSDDTGEGTVPSDHASLDVAVATRRIDPTWRIWSFSSISAAAAPYRDETRPEAPAGGGTDEPAIDPSVDPAVDPVAGIGPGIEPGQVASGLLRSMVGGTAFGTMVHEVLEQVDFSDPALDEHLRTEIDRRVRSRRLRVDPEVLTDGLVAALEAPLGGPLGPVRLRDVTRADRLDELQFDLPLGRLRPDGIARVLLDHLAVTDPLRPWAERVADGALPLDVEGMLTGSIDLVLRHRTPGDPFERYVVVDYKTNQLGIDNEYAGSDLAAAMDHHHYPLQALIYLVALHRYLRWRVPDYRPVRHLAGAAYLFVRGMEPDRAPDDARGVWWWTPSVDAVDALDRLLAGADR